jgi:hypothetical protein
MCSGCAGTNNVTPSLPAVVSPGPMADGRQLSTSDAATPIAANSARPVLNAEEVVRAQIHPLAKACFGDALRNADVYGKVIIQLHVAPTGEVDRADTFRAEGVLPPTFTSCLENAVRAAKFEAPGGDGALLSIPFHFEARH